MSIPLTALPAQAAVTPVAAPHNIEVFPNIDMAGASGYDEPIVMEVWRDGVKVGTTGAPKTADPLEINHTAPDCWAGFTPDIIPGDQIRVLTADQIDVPVEEQVGEYMTVANIDADPARKVALDSDGIQNDVVMTGTASTLDGTAALPIAQLGAEIVQPAWRDNGWQRRAMGAVAGLPMPNATTPLPDGGDGVLAYDPVSATNPLGNHWTASWKNMTEPHATLALSGEQNVSYFERDDGLEGSGLTIMDVDDISGPATGCPAAVSDSITGSTPAAANIAFVNGTGAMRVEGKAYNAASVRLTLDDSDGDATDAVNVDAVLSTPASTAETSAPVAPRNQTWTASFPNDAFDALADGDLRISGEFQRVIETSEQRTDPETGVESTVYVHNTTALPGRAHALVKDTAAPLAPTAFPAPGRYTTAQAITITPDDEIEDVVRYRTGDGTQADPTSGSPLAPAPLQVTSTQTVKARSYDKAGNASPTAALAYTIAAATVPPAPSGVSATPANTSATVVWTPASDDGGSAVTGWRVQVFTATGTTPLQTITVTDADPTLEPNQLSTVVGSLTNGTAYRFRVAGVNNVTGTLQYSALSAPVTPTAPVTVPGAPTIGAPTAGNAGATVRWTAPASTGGAAITGYSVRVYSGTTVVQTVTAAATATSLNVTGLTNGTAYTFDVRAVNSAGTGASSARSAAVTPTAPVTVPGAPTIGAPTAGNAGATVRWTAPASTGGAAITGYSIRAYSGTTVVQTVTAAATATSLNVTGLTNGTAYTFDVRAVNSAGTGAASARSAAVTPTAPVTAPGAPTIGAPTAGNANATVRWTAPATTGGAAITGYSVRVYTGTGTTVLRTQAVGVATSAVVTGLTNGTAYTFDVRAVSSAGTGAASARSAAVTPRTEFVAPTITARTPGVSARVVSQTGNITATFSEAVTGVSTTTATLRQGTTAVTAVVTYNATTRVVTIDPAATLLADRTYTVTLTSGIRDVAGNALAASSWSFTTGPRPVLTTRTPAANATGVSRTGNVTATFNEAVNGVSGTTVTLRTSAGAAVTAVVSYNATTRVATLNPSVTLAANTVYTATLTGGSTAIRDLAGNALTTTTWNFTTGAS